MLAELLEKFEDIFQPATDEELDVRWAHFPKIVRDLKPDESIDITDDVFYAYFNGDGISREEVKKVIDDSDEYTYKGDLLQANGTFIGYKYLNKQNTELILTNRRFGRSKDIGFSIRVEKNRFKNESFADIFKPLDPKEVEKRMPIWDIGIFIHDGDNTKHIKVKSLKVRSKFGSNITAMKTAIKKLGLDLESFGYVKLRGYWEITIYPSDNVKGDDGNLLKGKYMIYGMERV